MKEIYELVFEDLRTDLFLEMTKEIDSGLGKLPGFIAEFESLKLNDCNRDIVFEAISPEGVFSCLNELRYRILKYDNTFDFEVSWVGLSPEPKLIKKLVSIVESLKTKNCFRICYCGLEPACDEETRLFTVPHP